MNKTAVVLIAAFAASSPLSRAFAAPTAPPSAVVKERQSVAGRATERTRIAEHMKQQFATLGITPAQRAKIKEIMVDAQHRRGAIRMSNLPEGVKDARRLAIAKEARAKIAQLLTPGQRKEVAHMQQEGRAQILEQMRAQQAQQKKAASVARKPARH